MFAAFGQFVSRFWALLILAWIGFLVLLVSLAPPKESVLKEGEFAFLPKDSPSIVAERLLAKAFPDDLLGSTVVIVVRRPGRPAGLMDEDAPYDDRAYIHGTLVKVLQAIGVRSRDDDNDEELVFEDDEQLRAWAQEFRDLALEPNESDLVYRVRDFTHPGIGHLLESADDKASLVLVDLTTEFIDDRHIPIVESIEKLIQRLRTHPDDALRIPAGLDVAISGSATVGHDMRLAGAESAKRTELFTVILVLGLLILIYRAPLLALIPLMTVAMSVAAAMFLLTILAKHEIVSLFKDIETYITVIIYGAGVDYCLFLIARYKEELDGGATYDEAIANALAKVGHALTASAGTVMCGIGMMAFAEFGKFREAGIGITLSLVICLLAAMTFAPALMRLAGKWAFWPAVRTERIVQAGWISPTTLVGKLMESGLLTRGWGWITDRVRQRPGFLWSATALVMLPFAVIGVMFYNNLSYGLLSELPADNLSVAGARAVQDHFPAGWIGPITVLLENPAVDFSDRDTMDRVGELTERIEARKDELEVADVRSVAAPTGITPVAKAKEEAERTDPLRMRLRNARILKYYVSQSEAHENQVTRIDVVFENDPFARNSISNFVEFQQAIREMVAEFDEAVRRDAAELAAEEQFDDEEAALLPEEIPATSLYFLGSTASITDLKHVTDRDQIRIDLLVLAGVYLILVVLLRRAMISAYLLISVFFSYLVALGIAISVFYLLDPSGFAGLDWKVPMFLFTILIAVGEDYNIFLMTRIDEEQQEHGLEEGVLVALRRTGSIISSCGIIMAGTFASLLAGSLVGMQQLGFALATGVLLDTFVVRPILVPAWLVMLYRGRFGRFGKYLGAPRPTAAEPPATPTPERAS